MSCWSAGVALGILVLLLCDGPGCGLHLDLSDNGTPAGLARVRKTAGELDTIFVHIGAKEFTIPCKSSEMDVVIGMNPTYNWSLENEETHPLSGDASLTLHDFHTDDSGLYVCTVSYTTDGQLHTKTFYHTVVGYHIRAELHVLLLFQCNSCDEELTHGFLKTLREHLSEVVHHLHCELLLGAISCFPTMEKPLDEFNFQVELEVSPFGKGWDKFCSPKADALEFDCYNGAVLSNLQQAEEAITIFMENNKRFPLGEVMDRPRSYRHAVPTAVVSGAAACPPGTYSVAAAGNCVPCPNGTYSLRYGTTVCIQCYHNGSTLHPAARTAAECMSPEVPPTHGFPALLVIFVVLLLTCLCIIVLCCWYFRRRRKKKQDSFPKGDGETKQEKEVTVLAVPDSPKDDSPLLPSPTLENAEKDDSPLLPSPTLENAEKDHSPLLPSPTLENAEKDDSPLLPSLTFENPDQEGVMFPTPPNPEEEPGGAVSPPPFELEEQPVIENVVFPSSSPVSDFEST
ncbi:pellucida-binding 2-like [Podarcis lilfordi]|uniref:Pellucida-binding 2-like n=1 Tax=Podarcis lilfordi TaxID=74358 RepID=A0AA35PAB1_9SAUR|nr:pellucida-binding 2-like [Podarcis lilfordi]